MSSEYEPPELDEIGSVSDLTGGNSPGEGDGLNIEPASTPSL
jgi:hypothetical protein